MENEFPGNSNAEKQPSKKAAQQPKEVKKVVTGEVVTRKKPLGRKVKEFVVGDDSKSVIQWIWSDVLIPGVKDTIFEAATGGLERRMFGESRRRRIGAGPMGAGGLFGNVTYNAYNRYSGASSTLRPDPRQQQAMPNRRGRANRKDIGEIILSTRVECTEVLDQMIAIIAQYDAVTLADLWEMLNTTGEFTDEKWGWTDLMGADVIKVHEGYLLDLPAPVSLD